MKRLLLLLAFAPAVAWAQPSAGPGPQAQPGCVVNVACQGATLALAGQALSTNTLASPGFSVNSTGGLTAQAVFTSAQVQASGGSFFGFGGKTSIFSSTDGTVQFKNNAATRQLSLDFSGIPVPTGTGTPTIATGSTDAAGEVTSGTSATSLVITFSSAKTNAPFCTVTPQTQLLAFAYTISTTAITITQTATTGEKVDYFCVQH